MPVSAAVTINSPSKKNFKPILEDVSPDMERSGHFRSTLERDLCRGPCRPTSAIFRAPSQAGGSIEALAAARCVFRARRRQHKHLRAVQPLLLQPRLATPLREILKGTHAIERDDLRRVLFELLRQQDAPLGKFLARQFLDPARGTLDEVGKPDAELDHPFVIPVIEQFRHHARIIQQRPEFVSTSRVIMADASRTVAGIAPDDDQFHAIA